MSQGGINIERQYLVRAADGTAYWDGLLSAGEIIEVNNTEASATMGFGEPIRLDSANTTASWPRWDLAATSEPIKKAIHALRTTAAANLMLIGVALENIAAGSVGRVAGKGSLVATKCLNPPTSNLVGSAVISDTTTAGQVNAVTSGAAYAQTIAHIQPGLALGLVAKPAGAGAAATGSTTQLGVYVSPF